MIAAWMSCFVVVGALLLRAAYAADAVCVRLHLARRVPWIVAMLAMCGLPLALRQLTPPLHRLTSNDASKSLTTGRTVRPDPAPITVTSLALPASPGAPAVAPPTAPRVRVAADSAWLAFDRVVLSAGAALSLGCVILLGTAHRRLGHARRHWTRAPEPMSRQLESFTRRPTALWCSDDVGPAALGVRTPEVVIPTWALELDDEALALLLMHEASHVTARDPLLLRIALAGVVAMPWNLPMLIAYRRLHRAVEHDCDARVLGATRDVRSYGRLLLTAAERLSRAGEARPRALADRWLPAAIAGIAMRPSELELRLKALVRPATTWAARTQTVAAAAVLVTASLLACSVPAPERAPAVASDRGVTVGPAFQVLARNRRANGDRTPTAIDSIAAMEAFMAKVMPRAQVLQDSIIGAAARRSEPHVFNGMATDVEDVWLLLNDDYTVRRSNTGRQYYSIATRGAAASTASPRVAATPDTPREALSLGVEAFVRAFPGITTRNVAGLWSSLTLSVGQRTVHVLWARYIPTPTVTGAQEDTFTVDDLLRRSRRSRTFSDTQREHASAQLDRLMTAAMQRHWQQVFVENPDRYPVLWVLFDHVGREITSGTGRDGLFALGADGKVPRPTTVNPARPETPPSELGIDCAAFASKFPDVAAARKTSACGMNRFPIPGSDRAVVVVFGISRAG